MINDATLAMKNANDVIDKIALQEDDIQGDPKLIT
jgi:hypothetical protein